MCALLHEQRHYLHLQQQEVGLPVEFLTSNLVVVVVLLAIALISIVVKATQQENTEGLSSGSVKAIYH